MVETGIAEELELIDSNSNDRTTDLGLHGTATFQIDQDHNEERSIDSGGKPNAIRDGLVEFPAELEIKPTSLKALRMMGKYQELDTDSDGNDDTWEITFPGNEKLESHNYFRGQILNDSSNTNYFEFRNVKFGHFRMETGVDDAVMITFPTILAEDGDIQDGKIDAADTSGSPLQWTDCDVKIDGSTVGTIEGVSPEVNRNISSEHGITDKTGADARKPVAVTEGNYEIQPAFVVKIEDTTAWEEALDDTGSTIEVQGSKSSKKVEFDFGGTEGSLIIQRGKLNAEGYDFDEEKDDTRTVELSGVAEDVKIRGDL